MGLRLSGKGMLSLTLAVFVLATVLLLYSPGIARGQVTVVPETVRVGLALRAPEISFKVQGSYQLVSVSEKTNIFELTSGTKYVVRAEDGLLKVFVEGFQLGAYAGPIRLEQVKQGLSIATGNGSITQKNLAEGLFVVGASGRVLPLQESLSQVELAAAGGTGRLMLAGTLNLAELSLGGVTARYRGNMELRRDDSGMTVINELPIEEYLYGVLPSEVYAGWPAEVLKAQAVAARTYLLSQLGNRSQQGFDVLASQMSQVYKGYNAEHEATTRAVGQTAGWVMTLHQRPIAAFFHASSGGYTENCEEVWMDTLAYIRGRPDPFDLNSRYYDWETFYNQQQLVQVLADKGYLFSPQVVFSRVDDLMEIKKTTSGARVQVMAIKGLDADGRPVTVQVSNADRVRMALGLRSALFQMEKIADPGGGLVAVTFRGSGWGHGLGMSQWGAYGMANQGYNYQEILKYYYTGIEMNPNYGY